MNNFSLSLFQDYEIAAWVLIKTAYIWGYFPFIFSLILIRPFLVWANFYFACVVVCSVGRQRFPTTARFQISGAQHRSQQMWGIFEGPFIEYLQLHPCLYGLFKKTTSFKFSLWLGKKYTIAVIDQMAQLRQITGVFKSLNKHSDTLAVSPEQSGIAVRLIRISQVCYLCTEFIDSLCNALNFRGFLITFRFYVVSSSELYHLSYSVF